jgi:hypothetical protein
MIAPNRVFRAEKYFWLGEVRDEKKRDPAESRFRLRRRKISVAAYAD